jgi:hypothetical protein
VGRNLLVIFLYFNLKRSIKMKKILIFGIVSLILLAIVLSGCKEKLQVCPDEKVINKMPADIIIKYFGPSRTYYLLNGQRKEISEFDNNWVENNCNVTVIIEE